MVIAQCQGEKTDEVIGCYRDKKLINTGFTGSGNAFLFNLTRNTKHLIDPSKKMRPTITMKLKVLMSEKILSSTTPGLEKTKLNVQNGNHKQKEIVQMNV